MKTYCICSVLFLVALLAGCGTPTQLQGMVTLDDKPLSEGSISFEPMDGAGPSCGAAIKEGKFQVQGDSPIPPGKKRVRIRGSMKTGKQIPAGPPHPPSAMIDEVQYFPPEGEKDQVQEAEVVAGEINDLEFKLATTAEKS